MAATPSRAVRATQQQPETFTAKLAAIEALRVETHGILVSPPQEMTEANVRQWLMKVAEKGSRYDLELCWSKVVTDKQVKEKLVDLYRRLQLQADRTYGALIDAAEAERVIEREKARAVYEKEQLRADISHHEEQIAAKKARLEAMG